MKAYIDANAITIRSAEAQNHISLCSTANKIYSYGLPHASKETHTHTTSSPHEEITNAQISPCTIHTLQTPSIYNTGAVVVDDGLERERAPTHKAKNLYRATPQRGRSR